MPDPKSVFISYVRENKALAGQLAELLTERGARVVLDVNVVTGDHWPGAVRDQIEKSSALVLLIPPAGGTDRNNVWFEAGVARALGKRVLAVLPPKSRSSQLPSDVADILVLDADQRPLESIADTLMQAVPGNSKALVS